MSLVNRYNILEVSDDEETIVKKPTTPVVAPVVTTPSTVAGKTAGKTGATKENAKPANDKSVPAAKQGEKKPAGQKIEGQQQKGDKAPRAPRPEGQQQQQQQSFAESSPISDRPSRPRPEGERRPRPEGERRPRPEGEGGERRPRPEGEGGERRPRPEGERRPRPEGEGGERRPRPEGERRPRPEGEGGERRPRGRRQEEGAHEHTEENKNVTEVPKSDLPPRKRQLDRRGPPRKEGEKSEYHGKGNWGRPGTESSGTEEKPEGETTEASTTEQTEKPAETVPVVEAEPEDKTITLAEFKKLKESQKKAVQQSTVRKANEGVDTSAWKNTEQFVRQEETYYVPVDKSSASKKKTTPERKAPEVIEFTPKSLIEEKQYSRERRFDDKRRGKGQRSKVEPPKLDDKTAFPSLK